MELLGFLVAIICASIPGVILVLLAIFGIRSRIKYADRLRVAQASGAFADLNAPKNRTRFRRLAVSALVGVLGMTLSIAVLVLQLANKSSNLYWVTITIALIFGSIGAVAGFLMQREINRRL